MNSKVYKLEIEMVAMKNSNKHLLICWQEAYTTDFIKRDSVESEPAEVIVKAKNDWIGKESKHSVIVKFLRDYEKTNIDNDYVRRDDITCWLLIFNDGISIKKFG